MQRLDEIVAQLLAGARQRIVTEHDCVASNDDAPGARIDRAAAELEVMMQRKRPNRRRRRRKEI